MRLYLVAKVEKAGFALITWNLGSRKVVVGVRRWIARSMSMSMRSQSCETKLISICQVLSNCRCNLPCDDSLKHFVSPQTMESTL